MNDVDPHRAMDIAAEASALTAIGSPAADVSQHLLNKFNPTLKELEAARVEALEANTFRMPEVLRDDGFPPRAEHDEEGLFRRAVDDVLLVTIERLQTSEE